jgi:hypothetical protein
VSSYLKFKIAVTPTRCSPTWRRRSGGLDNETVLQFFWFCE